MRDDSFLGFCIANAFETFSDIYSTSAFCLCRAVRCLPVLASAC